MSVSFSTSFGFFLLSVNVEINFGFQGFDFGAQFVELVFFHIGIVAFCSPKEVAFYKELVLGLWEWVG